MHSNLERRFFKLLVAENTRMIAVEAFKIRFHLLFEALAADLGKTGLDLAKMMGWEPVPITGNAVMRGEAEPSDCDIYRLLGIWEESQR